MKATSPLNPALIALIALVASSHASTDNILVPRDGPTEAYINSVCSPNITTGATGPLPPCIAVTNIESACAPNGTSPLAYEAHAQCMCKGSYFADWNGCQQCLLYHGARSEHDIALYGAIASSASALLCTGTPTAAFQSLFSNIAPPATVTGATTTAADQKSGDAAVSLYYTPSGSQGPGGITGSATAATATAKPTTSGSGSGNATSRGGSTSTSGASGAGTSTTSTPNAAAPTGMAQGVLLAIAGAVAVAL